MINWIVCFLGLALATGSSAGRDARPADVLSWRHQILEPERYRELARQWEAYTAENPADARAWVQYGQALRYSGRQEEALAAYARAFAADSADAMAVAAFVSSQISRAQDAYTVAVQHQRLVRAAALDPEYPDTYYTLWLTSMRGGDEARARECLRRMVALGDMPRALVDYGYNMLIGAPADAIVITNGDNDTYPPLAVQALRGLRPDVAIVNLSLLNTEWYIRRLRDRGLPIPFDDAAVAGLRGTRENLVLVRAMHDQLAARGWPRPICYSVTVPESSRRLPGGLVAEGLLLRVVPGAAAPAAKPEVDLGRTRELFDTAYRTESLTDPLADWERESSVARMGLNYVPLLEALSEAPPSPDAACDSGVYLYRAVEILSALGEHGCPDCRERILQRWAESAPTSPWLARARKLSG
jgi:hypothetical protein